MNDQSHQKVAKPPFEPPRLVTIELAAEEVLANACKLGSATSAYDAQPCTITSCSSQGS